MDQGNEILGIGNDIIEIERIRSAYCRHGKHFLNRLFSEKEQAYCLKFKDPVPRLAARFSAKESIAKALGVGFGKELSWLDIEILHDSKGKPVVIFSKTINDHFDFPKVLLSISHCKQYATTTAIRIKKKEACRKG